MDEPGTTGTTPEAKNGRWDRIKETLLRRRARKEAGALVREARRALRRHSYRVPEDVRKEIAASADALESARQAGDHDALCKALVALDHGRARLPGG